MRTYLTDEEKKLVEEAERKIDIAVNKANSGDTDFQEFWSAVRQLYMVQTPRVHVAVAATLWRGLKAKRALELQYAEQLHRELKERIPQLIEASTKPGAENFSCFLSDALPAALYYLSEWIEDAHALEVRTDDKEVAQHILKISLYYVGAAFYVARLEPTLRSYLNAYFEAGGAPPKEDTMKYCVASMNDELLRRGNDIRSAQQLIGKLKKEVISKRFKAKQMRVKASAT
jgi:hypothetical protein